MHATRVLRAGVSATKFTRSRARARAHDLHAAPDAPTRHQHDHAHDARTTRTGSLPEIFALIDRSALSPAGRDRAKALFQRLAEAEAAIHQMPVEQVHLHEVGALDSIIDIVGAVFALEWFGADRIVCSPLNVGGGMVQSAHGLFPVPAPATVKLLGDAPIYSGAVQKELVTPTGALIVTTYASAFGPMPAMTVERVGYGAGDRDYRGDAERAARPHRPARPRRGPDAERVTVIECEIDDMNPQIFGVAMDRLYAAGALEVFYVPVQMKKNRPGTLLTVVAPPERARGADRRSSSARRRRSACGTPRSIASACSARSSPSRRRSAPSASRSRGATAASSTPCPSSRTARSWPRRRNLLGQGSAGAGGRAYAGSRSTAVSRFFLTTAIDYVNSRPHLGTAYEKIAADVIARVQAPRGFDDALPDGQRRALAERVQEGGRSRGSTRWRTATRWSRSSAAPGGTSTSRSTTSSGRPSRATRRASPSSRRGSTTRGDIYEGVYEGWYCVGCEAFKQEKDLVDGNCPLHPTTTPQWIREKNYFFRLSKYQQPLLDHFARAPGVPAARRPAERDPAAASRAASRTSRSAAPGSRGAFRCRSIRRASSTSGSTRSINYASAVGLGGRPRRCSSKWWPADLHVIGKDITRFHAVIWPAMLMSAKLPLPRQVFGHGFMTLNGQRMSKSLGTIVDPIEAADRLRRRSAAAVSDEGDRVRRRRRLLRGSASTSATTSISRTTSATWSAASRRWRHRYRAGPPAPGGGAASEPAGAARRRGWSADVPARDGRVRAARGRGGGVSG